MDRMDSDGAAKNTLDQAQLRAAAIRKTILDEEKRIRQQHPWLARQDLIGFLLWLGSLIVIAMNAYSYVADKVSAWVALPVAAIAMAVLHELEHDLIHSEYFSDTPVMEDIMFFGIWVSKLSMSPWYRRKIHLLHHRDSGQRIDVEERLLGLGTPNHLLRLATAVLPALAGVYALNIERASKGVTDWKLLRGNGWCSRERWLQHIDTLFFTAPLWVGVLAWQGNYWAQVAMTVWVGPNILRHTSLALLSSYSHYYEITSHDITQQNQILSHWALTPLAVFCCNFGAEHIIHHYVVGQPFYIRHMVRHAAWKTMREQGVRENDWGTVWRANRYGPWSPKGGLLGWLKLE